MTITNIWKLANPMPQYSAFKGKPFEEQLDLVLMKMIRDDPRCLDEWKETLEKIIDRTDPRTNKQYIKHKQPYGIGRHYADDNVSIINLKREIKHSLMEYLGWMDLDMVKAHPSIICELGRKNDVEFQHIRNYLNDPNHYNQMLIQYYSGDPENPVNDDDIKELIRSAGYGGGFKSWRDGLGKDLLHQNKHPFIADFISDCRRAIDLVYLYNPELAEKVKEGEQNVYKIKSRTMSYFCGAIENDALHIAYKFLIKKDLLRERTGALEYDGLCFKPLKAFNIPAITTELNDLIRSKLGLELKFKIKGYDRVMFADLIEARRAIVEAEPVGVMTVSDAEAVGGEPDDLRLARNYPMFKLMFEKTHAKIINKTVFIKAVRDIDETFKEFIMFDEQKLKASYRHLSYMKMTKMGEQLAFYIEDWLEDPMMRLYEDIDCIPPPLKCPSSIFNLWSPFRAEQLRCPDMIIGEEDDDEEQERKQVIIDDAMFKVGYIQNHIKVLLNNDAVVFDYFMMWLGQMMKYPAIKTIAPCLISFQGSGKGTIIKYMMRMMGHTKVLETSEPEKVVWGHFNELMMNCYFVSLNEMEKRAQEQADGRIKALITDGELVINPKGKGHIKTKSYHRFMYSSNNEVPVQTEEGDRRNLIIRCSDEWKIRPHSPTFDRNVKHFVDLNAWLEDDNVIWLLYKCLTSIPNLDKFHKLPLPITEYQAIIQDANKKPIERWLKEWVGINYHEGELVDGVKHIKIQSKRLLDEFKQFKEANSIKWETNTAKLIRDIQLLQMPQGTITTYKQGEPDIHKLHTRTGNLIMLNMDKLKQHFGMLNMEFHDTLGFGEQADDELDEDNDM